MSDSFWDKFWLIVYYKKLLVYKTSIKSIFFKEQIYNHTKKQYRILLSLKSIDKKMIKIE